jgi:hypothetical protein
MFKCYIYIRQCLTIFDEHVTEFTMIVGGVRHQILTTEEEQKNGWLNASPGRNLRKQYSG